MRVNGEYIVDPHKAESDERTAHMMREKKLLGKEKRSAKRVKATRA